MLTFIVISIIGLAVVAITATPWRRRFKLVLIGTILLVSLSVSFYRYIAVSDQSSPRTEYQGLIAQGGEEKISAQRVLDSLTLIPHSSARRR